MKWRLPFVLGGAAMLLVGNIAVAITVDTRGDAQANGSGTESAVSGEAVLVEVHCHKFKFMAGHAIANIEAAHEVIDEALFEFDPLGMNFRLSDYADDATGLRGIIDDACAVPTLDEARPHVAVFRSEAERIRNQFSGLQGLMRADLESYIEQHQDEIRAAYEEELREEVKDLEEEARARLKAQLEAEAETKKKEMQDRIQKEVENEIMAEYGGQENPDIAYLQKIGEERGRAKGEAEAEAVEAQLRVKYEALAEEEVIKLKAAATERAGEKEAELRQVMSGLGDVGSEISARAEEKFQTEWAGFEEKAAEAGQQVYRAFVEAEFDKARNLIIAEQGLVENTPQEIRDRYGIQSIQDLLDQIDADEKEVLATLANVRDISDEDAQRFREKFSEKWIELQQKLERLKANSSAMVMRQVEKALERTPGASSGKVENYLANTRKAMLGRKSQLDTIGRNCITDRSYADSNCVMCNTLSFRSNLVEYGDRVVAQIDKCNGLLDLFDGKKSAADAGTLPIDQAMTYGNDVRSCLEGLRAMHDPYLELKGILENAEKTIGAKACGQ
jgi:hypothetical protein